MITYSNGKSRIGQTGRVADNIQLQSVISECFNSKIVILGSVVFSPFNDVTGFYWIIAWSQTLLPLYFCIPLILCVCEYECDLCISGV
jgi:hypothetical protein